METLTAHDDLTAELLRILDLSFGLLQTSRRRDWAESRLLLCSVADDQLLGLGGEHFGELVVDASLDIHAVCCDTGLSGMSPLERHQLSDSLFDIGIVEHQERTVTTQLESDLLQSIGTDLRDDLANTSAAGECDLGMLEIVNMGAGSTNLLDQWMSAKCFAKRWSLVQAGGQHAEDTLLKSSLLCKVCKRQDRERGLWRRLDNHCAASSQSCTTLSQNHCNRDYLVSK